MPDMPSDAVRPQARKSDWAADIAELIMASGQLPAPKGRTYDCTVPAASNLKKHLASRAVPHMRQSPLSTPIDSLFLSAPLGPLHLHGNISMLIDVITKKTLTMSRSGI